MHCGCYIGGVGEYGGGCPGVASVRNGGGWGTYGLVSRCFVR